MKIQSKLVIVIMAFLVTFSIGLIPVNAYEDPCDGANHLTNNFYDIGTMTNVVYGLSYVPSSSCTIMRIELFAGDYESSVAFAIWSDDGGAPSKPLANLGNTEYITSSATPSWQGANLLQPVSVIEGTKYWIIVHPLSTLRVYGEIGGTIIPHVYSPTGDVTGGATSWVGPFPHYEFKYRLFDYVETPLMPVGGEIVAINQLTVLGPYLFFIIFLVSGAGLLFRKRFHL